MDLFITILHIVLSFALILIILLQPGKDGAAVFGGGGGGNQMYGARGQANFLSRATTVVAAMFMFTSITLAYKSSLRNQAGSDIEDDIRRLQEERNAGTATDKLPLEVEDPGPPPSSIPAPVTTPEPTPLSEDEPSMDAPRVGASSNDELTNPVLEDAQNSPLDGE